MTDAINPAEVGQTEYMKLFMQELTYQDPLKPVDNREFMAQMAQFSALQQATETNDKLQKLISALYGNRAISLMHERNNEYVKINGSNSYGQVKSTRFNADGTFELRVLMEDGGDPWIGIDQISEITSKD